MLGAIQGQIESDMNYLATNMGERLNAKAYQLHAPAFADTKNMVMLCDLWSRLKISLILPAMQTSHF